MTSAGAAGRAAPAPYALRDEVSFARMVGVEGLPSPGAAAAATLAPAPGNG